MNHLHRVGHRCCPRTWQLGPTERHSLFHSKRDRLIKDPRKWFATALEPARIDGVTWQTLRHTFASRLELAGVNLKTVQELTGHQTIAMTAWYSRLAPDSHVAGAGYPGSPRIGFGTKWLQIGCQRQKCHEDFKIE